MERMQADPNTFRLTELCNDLARSLHADLRVIFHEIAKRVGDALLDVV